MGNDSIQDQLDEIQEDTTSMEEKMEAVEAVKQQGNKKEPTGFQLHPENINRNGRPTKGNTITDIMKEILEEELPTGMKRKEALARRILEEAYKGNDAMTRLALGYLEGMPTQRLEIDKPNLLLDEPTEI